MEYKTTELQSLCDVRSSKRIYAKELISSGVPFYRSKEIIEKLNGVKEHSSPLYISEKKFEEIARNSGSLSTDDLLLTSRGTLGVPYIVKASDRFHFADGNLTWFRNFKGLNSKYLKYFFLSNLGKGELARCVIGSSQQAYTIASIKKISIPLPNIEYQEKVVGVLAAYDSLIENNRRRIAILEDMAQSLYREWFVNFRYPEHEDNLDVDGNPKLVDSPLGQIPEGWTVAEISSIAKVKGGKRLPKGKKVLDSKTNYPYLRVKDFAETGIDRADIKYIDDESHLATKRYVISSKDIYISIAGTIGRVGIVPSDLDGANITENAAKICELTDPFYQHYLLRYLRSFMGKKSVQSRASGSSQPKLALYKIAELPIVIPTKQVLEEFHKISSSLNKQIEVLDRTNLNLKNQRDMLLPKLISGQIDL